MALRALHLCSGYGGFELGLRLAGVPARTVAHVERDSYAAATLVARMEDQTLDRAPIWSDLTTFDGGPWRGRVDLITAGFPCQPFSAAGLGRGVDDERWLWPDIARIVADVGPRFVFLENVPQLVRLGLPHVLADLAALGFDAEWGLLSAAEVGAPHKRERFWLLADAACIDEREQNRAQRTVARQWTRRDVGGSGGNVADSKSPRHAGGVRDTCGTPSQQSRPTFDRRWPPQRDDHDGWAEYITQGGPEPSVRRSTDGPPEGLADALHAGGNGLVPAVAAHAFIALSERLGR